MWRPLARRALLNRGTAAQKLLPPVFNLQVPNPETVALPLPSAESASRLSFFSAKSHVYGSLRLFSSNPAEKYEDPASELPISEANEITEANKGVGENFEGSVSLDENLDYVAAEDEGLGEVKKNDPEKVESLLSLLQSSGTDTGSLESNMEGMDLVLDEEFVLKVVDALVTAICMGNRRREAYALWDLINEVGEKEKGVVSTDCLNELIAEFSRLGKGKAAFDVFNKFEQFGCLLNADTYYLTIEALCKRSFYNWASSVCEKMLNSDNLPDVERVGKIISYLCKGGLTKDAHLVYMYAKDKKTYLPRSSINFLVGSLSRIEKTEMLNDYSPLDRKYATKPFSSVIKKLCWIEDVDRAKKLLLEMIDIGPPPGNTVFNCVINGLTKSGDMEEATKMMKLLENRGLKPDVYTYSVIMSGYARGGAMEEACKIYDEAKKRHAKLSPVTFHTLIRGFCKLEQYDKAVSLIGEMKQHGVNPNHDEYNKLIKSLCLKALDWETAEKLQGEMKVNGLILNGRTSALIRAVKQLKEGVPL
ncbi:Pentatricopeptide repeat-containing protein, mitochondrial [Sesamum angolense]|uniref:Pentatricopeptide repeat-containing protein, mitochondrial n=1 Tax=Sesamum angolense TaxID=2727404 RepID=A0AAE2BMQ0_9LAMI|nr:Pentatricopeptide repeat-containing protein, mitochondrial [Sesamum angolense]